MKYNGKAESNLTEKKKIKKTGEQSVE